MTSIKDKLKGSQGSSDIIKLPIVYKYKVGEEVGDNVFLRYDKTESKNIASDKPIKGIYIGNAMHLTFFDDRLGSKGGNYFSNYYFNRDLIVLMESDKGTIKTVAKGTMDDIEKWGATNTTGQKANKRLCLFVLTSDGLMEIQTNLSIGIDQLKANKDALLEKYIILNPNIFSQNNADISRNCKQILGKFATKNPPRYAQITAGELITESDFEKWQADSIIENYKAWKEQAAKGIVPKEEKAAEQSKITPNQNAERKDDFMEGLEAPVESEDQLPF